MSPGYGDRIYVKRPRRHPWMRLLMLLTGLGLILFFFLNEHPTKSEESDPEQTPDIRETAAEPLWPAEEDTDTKAPKTDPPLPLPSLQESVDLPRPNSHSEQDSVMIAQARALIDQRRYQDAITSLTPLPQHSILAMLLAAEAHYALLRYTESQRLLEQVLEANPKNSAVIKRLAITCYAQNQLDDALHYCRLGLEINEHDLELIAICRRIDNELETSSGFTSRESQHFSVSFDRGEHDDIRQTVLSILEGAHRQLGRDLGVYPERIIPVILYTQKTFFDVTRAPGWAGGLYDGKIRLPVAGIIEDESELTRILTHEYVHALVHQLTDQCPLWINEGLAEYFSQDDVPEIGQLIPLEQLEHRFPSAPVRAVAIAYAQSHAAVNYLIRRYSLSDLLTLLKKLGEGQPLREAFSEIYYIDYGRFLGSWGKE